MMKKNILTHIVSQPILNVLIEIFDNIGVVNLNVDDYEDLLYATVNSKPQLVILEINSLDDPYFKIANMIKKSKLANHIEIVIITDMLEEAFINDLFDSGVADVIREPYISSLIKNQIENVMRVEEWGSMVNQAQEVKDVQSVIISSLATLTEYRDPETGQHIKRTQNYVKALALTLRKKGVYLDQLSDEHIEAMYMSVPLHDIGKVGIPDNILLKPGKLTNDEIEIMKKHTEIGYETILKIGNRLKNSSFLELASDVAYTHHEKYDGSGYPRGLIGNEIPLIGRLMAVADVYDALTSKRVYKDAMEHDEALKIIQEASGTHFDPELVHYMSLIERTFKNIAKTYKDADEDVVSSFDLSLLVKDGLLSKILIVEDSRIVRRVLKNQLEALGFDVSEAVDGVEGLRMSIEGDYDLILIDVEMPKMNGYEMATQIKKVRNNGAVMFAITATDYDITIEDLQKLGISDILLKPVDLNQLANKYLHAKKICFQG